MKRFEITKWGLNIISDLKWGWWIILLIILFPLYATVLNTLLILDLILIIINIEKNDEIRVKIEKK
jgi:hypothetical protein